MRKIYIISLGCVKNRVDSEILLGNLAKMGFEVTDQMEESDLIMVNTCAFIESAKEEAIATIFEVVEARTTQKIVIVGCLPTRYNEMSELIPEVDRFIPISEYGKLPIILSSLYKDDYLSEYDFNHRLITTSNESVYVKISEGCNNRCAYCAIPLIRGNFVSRPTQAIVNEVKELVLSGAKEINLISQDTTNYGREIKSSLVELLKELLKIEGDFQIRLLYLYPDLVTEELIQFMATEEKMIPYFDIPIQHSENRILKLMNRRGTKEEYLTLFQTIKQQIPKAILRTTVIVGFPTETEDEFVALLEFIKEVKFDRLGAFSYSREEDTASYHMILQISEEEKQRRLDQVYLVQSLISEELSQKHLGEMMDVLVEGYEKDSFFYYGRSYAYAPDEIDGKIYFAAMREIKVGEVVSVKILNVEEENLIGEELTK